LTKLPPGYKIEVALAEHVSAIDDAAVRAEVLVSPEHEQGRVPGLVGSVATMPSTPRPDTLEPPQLQAQAPPVVEGVPPAAGQVAIRVPPVQQKLLNASPNYTRAVAYVSVIKKRFQGQPHVFQ